MTSSKQSLAPIWACSVLTLFPGMFPGPLGESLSGRALKAGIWSLDAIDIRSFAKSKHRSVDDTPAGGGPGMVLRPDVLGAAIDAAWSPDSGRSLVCMSPRGQLLNQAVVRQLASEPGTVIICGHYEGIDQRVLDARPVREISVGDYVLSGGEVAAITLIDAVVRLLPGVAGNARSIEHESFENGLLEHPHYTKPKTWEGRDIPEVLTSGHHARIEAWRQNQSEGSTLTRRPDLWARRDSQQKQKASAKDA